MGATSVTDPARGPATGPSGCQFIDFERYQSLLVSRRAIHRADDATRGLRGLLDRDTGMLHLIAEEQLPRPARSYAS